ncbi:LPXTG cell wall anchor domain-containing protein [Olsenella sp. An290]|uniref:LPXTG cell wall anchor domain-containing protein n=1 Tax=Olsenella sp. An290 TaxID=1965625 RepID=UPI0011806461|nr:LPXTG cell wall anchor domain-containing protein [Olsenella sp. An290]
MPPATSGDAERPGGGSIPQTGDASAPAGTALALGTLAAVAAGALLRESRRTRA